MEATKPEIPSISLNHVFATLAAVIFTWLLHEFGHWITGELLGNTMVMTINSGYPVPGYRGLSDPFFIDLAGPVITILQAFVFYFILKRRYNPLLYPFLATCLYMRLLAGLMNIVNLNDEGRISNGLNWGTYTLPLLVVALLFYPVYRISKQYSMTPKFIALTFILIMLFSSALILADQYMKIRLL